MTDASWEQYIEYSENEYLTNSYSLVIEGCEFEKYDEVIEPNNALLGSSLLDFNNTYNRLEESFFSIHNIENETIEPSLILLDNPDNNSLDFLEDNLEETNFSSVYQYNLHIGDIFDDWQSVDTFIHQYCLERGFGYQVFRNDKDQNDSSIIRRKSFRCSSSGTYEARKGIDQNLHRQRNTNKCNCEWHCNFTFPKTAHQIKCTTLKDEHSHELIPNQIAHTIARYRRFNSNMIQDLEFFTNCKVAPIVQLEILKKKYPEHVFHKQDVYNAIYRLQKDCKDESLDSSSLLEIFFEKITQDLRWKVFVRHTGKERRLSGIFWMSPSQQELYQRFYDVVLNDNTCKTNKYNMYLSVFMIKDNYGKFRNVANALVDNELSSTYVWILQCLANSTDNIIPKTFWTDSEPGLINAVSQVFPTTHHFYCLFHIWQNIIKHLRSKLGTDFHLFSQAFYLCRNALSIELFEQKWKYMVETFPACNNYMTKTLYANRISWAKCYTPFHFNAGIQSTQSVESFNGIIKKALNSASTLCDVEKAIDKRHEQESQYCKLVDLKSQQTTVGLPHLSSQFFSNVDTVLVHFLTPLILSWQRFQISQSFTYEGCLASSIFEVSFIKKFQLYT